MKVSDWIHEHRFFIRNHSSPESRNLFFRIFMTVMMIIWNLNWLTAWKTGYLDQMLFVPIGMKVSDPVGYVITYIEILFSGYLTVVMMIRIPGRLMDYVDSKRKKSNVSSQPPEDWADRIDWRDGNS